MFLNQLVSSLCDFIHQGSILRQAVQEGHCVDGDDCLWIIVINGVLTEEY
jgi:hypothetical protein